LLVSDGLFIVFFSFEYEIKAYGVHGRGVLVLRGLAKHTQNLCGGEWGKCFKFWKLGAKYCENGDWEKYVGICMGREFWLEPGELWF
jgi:hypothetical protein